MAKDKRKVIVARRLSHRDLGAAKDVLKKQVGESITLGEIIGKVVSTSTKPDRFDDRKVTTRLEGLFRGTPADPRRPIIQATTLYLPEFYSSQIAGKLANMGDNAELPVHMTVEAQKQEKQKGKNAGPGYVLNLGLEMQGAGGKDAFDDIYAAFDVVPPPLLLEGPKKKKK